MQKNTRTKNTILNFSSSIGGQIITIVMKFIVRTVFIHTLGKSYLGINGLFVDILSMLSLAEMGVGSAIVYKLYEPIAKKDEQQINMLMDFYRIVYRYIGILIAAIGACLIPFLPTLIKDYDKLQALNINAVFVYLVYLVDSVSSYLFFAYKSSIIKADQKEYYINLIGYIFEIAKTLLQIITLYLWRSFEIYVIIVIIATISQNIIIAVFADRKYPYLKKKTEQKLSGEEKKNIFQDCGAIFIYKINAVVLKSTDNIVLSIFLGLDSVALYSNYLIFYSTIRSLFYKVFNSVGHSIGNLHTTHDLEREYKVFETVMLISAILGCTSFVGVYVVADEFILQWLGNEWTVNQPFAFLLGFELLTGAYKAAFSKYRTSYGLFRQGWARPLIGIIINIGVSIALVNKMGISGVLIGTILADWLTFIWYDPLILHKYGFEKKYPIRRCYLKFAKYTITGIVIGIIDHMVCKRLLIDAGWFSVIVHSIICGITVPASIILVSIRTQEAEYILKLGRKEIKGIKDKIKKVLSN